ncbi:penicillin-binding transpeptidase domain-containing protein [Flavobacterium sp. KBS0721]|uniref:penicillin-binding transpeptidase domain-containing protein n=1 Tax=Flavobacterium sp. KBS0721 TaxID=1179672 RepID=UPI00098E8883|nr:penicillin-binding transpeptidase domain-containing protein [Flavobacterium sp. KBS0721]QDW22863.1 class D beta-lactamase [Flavobacterium sp. KBS0721]
MKSTQFVFGILFIALLFSCSTKRKDNHFTSKNDEVLVRQDFKKYFDDCNVEGAIAIYDHKNHTWILSDTVATRKETLPASTFKIINLLIALETKTIASENDIVKWPGSTDTLKYDYRPNIYHDITVKEAFEVSAGWAFIELAKKIGKDNYKKYLTLCHYGNINLSQTDPDFWNFGAFGISPINQVEFLKKLYEEKLPFSKRNIDIVKKVMINEQNDDYTIHSKTGWTRENDINTGWWVGYIENKNGAYFFATRLLQDRKLNASNFGNCRKEITKSVFKNLNVIQ